MLSKVQSAAILGIDAFPITIEVDAIYGEKPTFRMVGLPDAAVRESYSRVRSALANSGKNVPPRVVTVNLSPADVRKVGSSFDLPIAVGMLRAVGALADEHLDGRVFVGELSLDGSIAPIRGALSISSAFGGMPGIREVIVPIANANEAAAARGVPVIGVGHLTTLFEHLIGTTSVPPAVPSPVQFEFVDHLDFAEVRGQTVAKRALEVAAAGGHNVLMIGPPGSGKTMLARRLPSILPPLGLRESIETTKIQSVAGLLPPGSALVTKRPFRAPHHTISYAGLIGGGGGPRPGEVSLAHNGVLFLDELAEFRRDVLEVMRQPMEEGEVTIARASRSLTFPARFTLAAALNPCPCGFFNDHRRQCLCTQERIVRYLAKISGPLLDRIDLQVEVAALSAAEVTSTSAGETSADIRERVQRARDIQRARFGKTAIRCNGGMRPQELREHCALDVASRRLLEAAMDKLQLSARGYDRILKVARSIADLEASASIKTSHLAEAIQYRSLDRTYFGPVGGELKRRA